MTGITVAPMSPIRKGVDMQTVQSCPFHVAACWTYRTLCSEKRLAYSWRIDQTTAGRYRNGQIVGALTRLLYEVILLERAGIRTTVVYQLVRRTALRERRLAADGRV